MEVVFSSEELDQLESDPEFTGGRAPEVVRGFRKALWAMRAARDIRDLYRGGLRCEKLLGKREGRHSVRINKQWRLVFELVTNEDGPFLYVIEIVDYH